LEPDHLSPNGRGALTRLDFSPSKVSFLRKMIDTPSAIMQQHISYGYDSFKLLGGMTYYSQTIGFVNYCNTPPNYLGDNRFALSLDLITPIGHYDEWQSSFPSWMSPFIPDKWLFPQVRTTGHPYFDLESEINGFFTPSARQFSAVSTMVSNIYLAADTLSLIKGGTTKSLAQE